jgi:monoamine oxidase
LKIGIIGAGASGLMAGRELTSKKISNFIIEARSRPGGRIHTIYQPACLELGAEFIHGKGGILQTLIDKAGLRTVSAEGVHLKGAGARIKEIQFWESIDKILVKIKKGKREDITFKEFLNGKESLLSAEEKRNISNFISGFNAAPLGKISSYVLLGEHDEGGKEGYKGRRLIEGYSGLIDYLAKGQEIYFNTKVKAVLWSKKKVDIYCQDLCSNEKKVFQCDKVLITLPPSILSKKMQIEFKPEISEKRKVCVEIGSGAVIKVILFLRKDFFEIKIMGKDSGFSFLHPVEGPFAVIWSQWPRNVPVLTGWIGGPAALKAGKLSYAKLLGLMLKSLAGSLGISADKIKPAVLWHTIVDWQKDPFSCGAYSFVKAGHLKAGVELGRPVKDTLFFAGEAVSEEGISGTVESALSSGKKVVKDIIDN